MNHQSGLSIVASYLYPYEAELTKALLESHDIPAWILDEHQIRQRWFLSGALGGVKVGVADQDLALARRIVSEDHSSDLRSIPEALLPPDSEELCPRCGAADARRRESATRPSGRTLLGIAASMFFASPVPIRTVQEQWTCSVCGEEWSREEPR